MMTISSVADMGNRMQTGMGGNMPNDSVSESIYKQMENAQKKLSDLSSNEEMPLEDKMKKRQEIQQEITSLNQQLRQHQIEMRKQRQPKGSSMEDMIGGKKAGAAKGGNGSGMSQASMQAMISADVSMKQAQVQGSVATQLEGKASILKSEIKMDKARGGNVEKKEEELADIEQNEQKAINSQMTTLTAANQAMEEAAKADQGGNSDKDNKEEPADVGGKAEKSNDRDEKRAGKAAEDSEKSVAEPAVQTAGKPVMDGAAVQAAEKPAMDVAEIEASQPTEHISIDIRL